MANLPVPVPASEVAGNLITGALWNANVFNGLTFMLNPPIFFGYQSTNQTGLSTGTPITIDTETLDSYAGHSNSTNPSRYTAQVPGAYMVWGGACVNGATSQTYIAAYIAKNGAETPGSRGMLPANSSHTYTCPTVPTVVNMVAGDYVELYVSVDGTSPSTHSGSTQTSSLTVIWIHT